MKHKRHVRRLFCTALVFVLLSAYVPCTASAEQVITGSLPAASITTQKAPAVAAQEMQKSKTGKLLPALPYIVDVLGDEIEDLAETIRGEDPRVDKEITEKGQNTYSNVAVTLIRAAQEFQPVRTLRVKLEPYADRKNVYEVCIYYTPLFAKDEQCWHTGLLHDYNTETIYMDDGTGVLGIGYDFNFDFDTFFSADDPWQRDFGFCPMYDKLAFLIGDVYDSCRIYFTYDNRDWMIQIWKGIYSYNMLGGEIGIYNKPLDREAPYFDCAADPDRLVMSIKVMLGDEVIVDTDEDLTWWQTSFTYHMHTLPKNLTFISTIEFPDTEMLKAFITGLQEASDEITYTTDGLTLTLTWNGAK